MADLIKGAGAILVCFVLLAPFAHAQSATGTGPTDLVEKAKVLSVGVTQIQNVPGTNTSATVQSLSAQVLSGPDVGKIVSVENDYLAMQPGDVFFLTHTIDTEAGEDAYTVLEPDRLPALGWLLAIFVLAVILVGGWTGVRGLLALAASILLVLYALLPGITAGYDPFLVSFGVAGLIVMFGSYLTHGIRRTTTAAVIGLLTTVGITALIAHVAISAAQLSGFADDSTVSLNFASQGHIDFVGLLLGAILIGALGILYDAAIGQAVAVEELRAAAPQMPRLRLFARAMRIGREHIGALVNTLVIAYVGVSLPLLLLFQSSGTDSFLETINHETFATEIVRAIVGTLGIVLAVPITTAVAIVLLTRASSASATMKDHGHTHGDRNP